MKVAVDIATANTQTSYVLRTYYVLARQPSHADLTLLPLEPVLQGLVSLWESNTPLKLWQVRHVHYTYVVGLHLQYLQLTWQTPLLGIQTSFLGFPHPRKHT